MARDQSYALDRVYTCSKPFIVSAPHRGVGRSEYLPYFQHISTGRTISEAFTERGGASAFIACWSSPSLSRPHHIRSAAS